MQQYILANPNRDDDPLRPWAMEKAPEKTEETTQPAVTAPSEALTLEET